MPRTISVDVGEPTPELWICSRGGTMVVIVVLGRVVRVTISIGVARGRVLLLRSVAGIHDEDER